LSPQSLSLCTPCQTEVSYTVTSPHISPVFTVRSLSVCVRHSRSLFPALALFRSHSLALSFAPAKRPLLHCAIHGAVQPTGLRPTELCNPRNCATHRTATYGAVQPTGLRPTGLCNPQDVTGLCNPQDCDPRGCATHGTATHEAVQSTGLFLILIALRGRSKSECSTSTVSSRSPCRFPTSTITSDKNYVSSLKSLFTPLL